MLEKTTSSWVTDRRAAAREKILAAAWVVAREQGLPALTLREVAARVGIRAPSLYSHFASKHAIYDAMFGDSWAEFLDLSRSVALPESPRAALRVIAHTFFEFATADLARYQLMNQRIIPGFAPSPETYAFAVTALTEMVDRLRGLGLRPSAADVDLYTALLGGLADQQWANDPGGSRWAALLDRAVDMYANDLDLPEEDS